MINCSVCNQLTTDENLDKQGIVLCSGCAREYILGKVELPERIEA